MKRIVKSRPKSFFWQRDSLSWKKFSENYLFLTETILYLIIGTNKPQKTSWTLIKCFLRFFILCNTRRTKLFFFIGMFAFLSFFFNNLSGLWELTFLLAPILLQYFVERDKIVMDVCKTRYYEKNCKSVFVHWKSNFSFRKFLFSTFTQLLQNWSRNLHNTCLNLFWAIWIAYWCHDTQ